MHTAVVELDALADAVRARSENDDLLAVAVANLVGVFVGRVVVRRGGLELGGAGIDRLERGVHSGCEASGTHLGLGDAPQVGELRIGEAELLGPLEAPRRDRIERQRLEMGPLLGDHRHLVEEPRIDCGGREDLVEAHTPTQQCLKLERTIGGSDRRHLHEFFGRDVVERRLARVGVETMAALLERTECLLHRLGEGSADGHDLTHRLHRRTEHPAGARELLERPARNLGDDIIDRRFEAGRGLLRDVVGDLVERVADRELGGDLGDREAGGLRRKGRRAAHTRVHFDDDLAAGLRVDRPLDIRAAGLDADPSDTGERTVAHLLVLDIGEGLGRSDGDGVAGVHTHRVEVLDRADDHTVVRAVTHDLELVLLPALDRLLDQDLRDGAGVEAVGRHALVLLHRLGDAGTPTAEDVGGPDDDGKADLVDRRPRLVHVVGDGGPGGLEPDLGHGDLELLAVLCRLDGLGICADQLAPEPLEHAGLLQLHRQVETGLATEGRQHGIGSFFFDDLLEDLQIERLDIGGVGETRIGHDRRRVRVREDDSIALFLQDSACLGTGVVELTGLTDHDRAGADDEDRFDIGALRHLRPPFPGSRP